MDSLKKIETKHSLENIESKFNNTITSSKTQPDGGDVVINSNQIKSLGGFNPESG